MDDPLEAGMRRLFRMTATAERNRVARKIIDLADIPEAKEFVRDIAPENYQGDYGGYA